MALPVYDKCPICGSPIVIERDDRKDLKDFGIYAWEDDPIKTPRGLAGEDYIGMTPLRWCYFREIQVARTQQEIDCGLTTVNQTIWLPLSDTQPIRMAHIEQLRKSTEKILAQLGLTLEDYLNYDYEGKEIKTTHQTTWTDPDLSLTKDLKGIYLEELRYQINVRPSWVHMTVDTARRWGNQVDMVVAYYYTYGWVGAYNIYYIVAQHWVEQFIGYRELDNEPDCWSPTETWYQPYYVKRCVQQLHGGSYYAGWGVLKGYKWAISKFTLKCNMYSPDVFYNMTGTFKIMAPNNTRWPTLGLKEYKVEPIFVEETPNYVEANFPFAGAIKLPSCSFIEDSLTGYSEEEQIFTLSSVVDNTNKKYEQAIPQIFTIKNAIAIEDLWEFRDIDPQYDINTIANAYHDQVVLIAQTWAYYRSDQVVGSRTSYQYSVMIPDYANLDNLKSFKKSTIVHAQIDYEDLSRIWGYALEDRNGNVNVIDFRYMIGIMYTSGETTNPWMEVEFFHDCLLAKDDGVDFVAKKYVNTTLYCDGSSALPIGYEDCIERTFTCKIGNTQYTLIEQVDMITYGPDAKVFYVKDNIINFGDSVHGYRPDEGLGALITGYAEELDVTKWYASGYIILTDYLDPDWDNPIDVYIGIKYYNFPNLMVRSRGYANNSYWSYEQVIGGPEYFSMQGITQGDLDVTYPNTYELAATGPGSMMSYCYNDNPIARIPLSHRPNKPDVDYQIISGNYYPY